MNESTLNEDRAALHDKLSLLQEKIKNDKDLHPQDYLESDVDLLYSIGDKYFSLQKFQEAEPFFIRLVLACPNSLIFWKKLALIRHCNKDYEGAILAYGMSSNLDSDSFYYHLCSCECFIALDLFDEADKCFSYVKKSILPEDPHFEKCGQIEIMLEGIDHGL